VITHTSIEDVEVEVVYDYEPAEPDIGIGEAFCITEINFKGTDLIEIIDEKYIDLIEGKLRDREI